MRVDTRPEPKPTETPAEIQERTRLSRRLTIAIATPMVLLVLLGLVLGRQLLEMEEDAAWVEHTDRVLTEANETLRQVSDQENAISNFLLTRDREALVPFERARPLEGFFRLRDLVVDNQPQVARFEAARLQYQTWLPSVAPLTTLDVKGQGPAIARFQDARHSMAAMRDLLLTGISVEEGLRRARVSTSAASNARTRVTFVGLLLASALLLALLSRRQRGHLHRGPRRGVRVTRRQRPRGVGPNGSNAAGRGSAGRADHRATRGPLSGGARQIHRRRRGRLLRQREWGLAPALGLRPGHAGGGPRHLPGR
jgi:CHASE3 domain sensor protein